MTGPGLNNLGAAIFLPYPFLFCNVPYGILFGFINPVNYSDFANNSPEIIIALPLQFLRIPENKSTEKLQSSN